MRLRIKHIVRDPEVSLYLGRKREKRFIVYQQKHESTQEVEQFGKWSQKSRIRRI